MVYRNCLIVSCSCCSSHSQGSVSACKLASKQLVTASNQWLIKQTSILICPSVSSDARSVFHYTRSTLVRSCQPAGADTEDRCYVESCAVTFPFSCWMVVTIVTWEDGLFCCHQCFAHTSYLWYLYCRRTRTPTWHSRKCLGHQRGPTCGCTRFPFPCLVMIRWNSCCRRV